MIDANDALDASFVRCFVFTSTPQNPIHAHPRPNPTAKILNLLHLRHLNLAVPFSLSDLDLPMALRKGNRRCTHHPISKVLSYCTLSPYYRALVFAISNRKGDILLRAYLTWLATEPVPAQSVFSKPSLVPCTCNPEQQKCFSLNLTFTLPACRTKRKNVSLSIPPAWLCLVRCDFERQRQF